MRPWNWEVEAASRSLCALVALGIIVPLRASSTDMAVLKQIASRVDDTRRRDLDRGLRSGALRRVAARPAHVHRRDARRRGRWLRRQLHGRSARADLQRCTSRTRAPSTARRSRASASTLAQPIRPRVRSSRNVIYVEADRLDRAGRRRHQRGRTVDASFATCTSSVAATSTAITLAGHRPPRADQRRGIEGRPGAALRRPANATSALPGVTPVGQGAVAERPHRPQREERVADACRHRDDAPVAVSPRAVGRRPAARR